MAKSVSPDGPGCLPSRLRRPPLSQKGRRRPQSGRPQQDLVGAQQLIDIIGMLELKTRGNLDREEAQLIEAILYELRMKYVERARTAR